MTNSPRNAPISSDWPAHGAADAPSTLRTSGALFLWLALQLAALGIAAFHWPLWAHAPESEDLLALQFLLVAQLGGSALLFPLLMRSWRETILITACSWPMIVLAGMLSSVSLRTILLAVIFITLWLLALAVIIWGIGKRPLEKRPTIDPPLSSTNIDLILVALVVAWTIGGPLMLFCRTEYDAGASAFGPLSKITFGPISSVFSAIFEATGSSWTPIAIVWLAAIVLSGTRVLKSSSSKYLYRSPAA